MELGSLAVCSAALSPLISQLSFANGFGVFGLHQAVSPDEHEAVLSQIKHNSLTSKCELLRQGKTNGAQGNLKISDNSHYFLLECPNAVLSSDGISNAIESIEKQTSNLVLLEGDFSDINRQGLSQEDDKRAYFLKLSHFNNQQPTQRKEELAAFKKEAYALDNHYYREAFIDVTDAYGMKRPDKVSIIYYDTPEKGDKFREANPQFIEKIGQFNMKHLTEFTYI